MPDLSTSLPAGLGSRVSGVGSRVQAPCGREGLCRRAAHSTYLGSRVQVLGSTRRLRSRVQGSTIQRAGSRV
eukprot:2505953-Rhodomonas_salina.2